jgi:hypothetical protein
MESASYSDFLPLYESWFGTFPAGEKDMGTVLSWRKFLDKVPADCLDRLIELVVNRKDRRDKPKLEAFQAALRKIEAECKERDRRKKFRNSELEEAIRLEGTPLFDFNQPWYPALREPNLRELPAINRAFYWNLTRKKTEGRLPESEYRALLDDAKVLVPSWGDYTRGEQEALLAKWKIDPMGLVLNEPEVEVPAEPEGKTAEPTSFDFENFAPLTSIRKRFEPEKPAGGDPPAEILF